MTIFSSIKHGLDSVVHEFKVVVSGVEHGISKVPHLLQEGIIGTADTISKVIEKSSDTLSVVESNLTKPFTSVFSQFGTPVLVIGGVLVAYFVYELGQTTRAVAPYAPEIARAAPAFFA